MEQARRLGPDLLRVPMRAEGPNGEIGDGMAEIGPDHPDYAAWDAWLSRQETDSGLTGAVSAAAQDVPTRELTADELAGGTDFAQIQADHAAAVAALAAALPVLLAPIAASLVASTSATLAGGSVAALGALTADAAAVTALAGRIADEATKLARLSARRASQELRGIGLPVSAVAPDVAALAGQAQATARLIASGMASAASRAALLHHGPGVSAETVADAVHAALDEITVDERGWVVGSLSSCMAAAQHAGRVAAFEALAAAHGDNASAIVASEVNDRNVCLPCHETDGRRFSSLAEAIATYPNGKNVACLGRDRCRGVLFAVRR